MAGVRFGEHFELTLSSLLGLSKYKPFVPEGCCLCGDYVCSCIRPHITSCFSKFCMTQLNSVQMGWKWGSGLSVTPLCSLPCVLWYESELSLCVCIFCYFASSLVSKTTFRTSLQIPYSLERNWPLPFQSANNLSHSFFSFTAFGKESSLKKTKTKNKTMNHLLEKDEQHARIVFFLVSIWDEKQGWWWEMSISCSLTCMVWRGNHELWSQRDLGTKSGSTT